MKKLITYTPYSKYIVHRLHPRCRKKRVCRFNEKFDSIIEQSPSQFHMALFPIAVLLISSVSEFHSSLKTVLMEEEATRDWNVCDHRSSRCVCEVKNSILQTNNLFYHFNRGEIPVSSSGWGRRKADTVRWKMNDGQFFKFIFVEWMESIQLNGQWDSGPGNGRGYSIISHHSFRERESKGSSQSVPNEIEVVHHGVQ